MFIEVAVDPVIDGESGRLVAAAETRHIAHSHFFRATCVECLFQAALQAGSAAQVTRHIGADADFSLRGRSQMEVRIKAGNRMDLAERHVNLDGEFLQPIGGQVAELMLNGPEFVDQATGSP